MKVYKYNIYATSSIILDNKLQFFYINSKHIQTRIDYEIKHLTYNGLSSFIANYFFKHSTSIKDVKFDIAISNLVNISRGIRSPYYIGYYLLYKKE